MVADLERQEQEMIKTLKETQAKAQEASEKLEEQVSKGKGDSFNVSKESPPRPRTPATKLTPARK